MADVISVEEAADELFSRISDAKDFIATELEPDWETAERYFNGQTDLPTYIGRSQVVKTEVRDAIRNIMPSIFRTLLQSRKIVEYVPTDIRLGAWAEQQSEYVTQRFWASDGYIQLHASVEDSAKLKYGVLKTHWIPNPKPRFFSYTRVPQAFFEQVASQPNVEIIEDEPYTEDGFLVHDFKGYERTTNGTSLVEAIPTYEFFIDQNSTSIKDAEERGVHGQSRLMTVSEAIELGLPEDYDWESVDSEDPETANHGGSSDARRNYAQREAPEQHDPMKKEVLVTECYASYDLEGAGFTQLYRFWLVGTNYKLVDYEMVDESPYDLVRLNLKGHTVASYSVADITVNEQDTGTSALRAALDNAHAANNPRVAANPKNTNFDDLKNTTALNAPVRTREQLQVFAVPFTGQGLMGILSYLDQDVQNKIGVTKAAQGLDPNAMQSTDKDAVLNTIQTSQGQLELMVRNIVEGTLVHVFRKLLRLSVEHFDPVQIMRTKGALIPIDLRHFNPDLIAIPNVGLGTASGMMKVQGLQFILSKQEQYMQTMGEDNPFTSYSQIYNTLEDIMEHFGIYDIGRYFKIITPQIEQQLAQRKAAQAQQAAANAPMDPSKAMMMIEAGKSRVKEQEMGLEREKFYRELGYKAKEAAAKLNTDRDRMIQQRNIELLKINQQDKADEIKKEQESDTTDLSAPSDRSGQTGNKEPRRPATSQPAAQRPSSGNPKPLPNGRGNGGA